MNFRKEKEMALNEKESNLVRQVFYTPMKGNGDHEILHIVHDVKKGSIYRVYTDNHLVKNFNQNEMLEKLPKLGEFTTTSREYTSVIKDAEENGILNKPL